MATHKLKWVANEHGAPPLIKTYPEGTSEVFLAGEPVIWDRSENGVVALSGTNGVPTTAAFLGIALEDASGTAATAIDVLIPQAGDVFSAVLASGESATLIPDQNNIGETGGIVVMNTATYDAVTAVFEGSAGGTGWVKIIALDGKDATRLGVDLTAASQTLDAGSRVYFKFLTSVLDSSGQQA